MKLSKNIKIGDIVVCVNNIGISGLKIGQEYIVERYSRSYGREYIKITEHGYNELMAERFLTKTEYLITQRLEKLNKINNIKNKK